MAEARQAVAFQFSVTEEGGLKFDYSTEGIKLLLLSGWKSTYRKYIQFRNSLLVGVFPASPISLLLIASSLVAGTHSGHFDVVGLCDRYISLIPWANSIGPTARWTTLFFFSAILLWFMFAYFMQQLLKCLLMYHGYMFDEHGRVSTKTKIWQLAVRLVSSQVIGKTRLYSYQRSLPSLPVPPLQDTCRRMANAHIVTLEKENTSLRTSQHSSSSPQLAEVPTSPHRRTTVSPTSLSMASLQSDTSLPQNAVIGQFMDDVDKMLASPSLHAENEPHTQIPSVLSSSSHHRNSLDTDQCLHKIDAILTKYFDQVTDLSKRMLDPNVSTSSS